MSPEISETLAGLYDQHRDNIISHLESTGECCAMLCCAVLCCWSIIHLPAAGMTFNTFGFLDLLGIAAPMIVGIDWRLDYSVRSKHGRLCVYLFVCSGLCVCSCLFLLLWGLE